jgi:uncharacterized protein YlaN (UPF0358 family)
MDFSMSKKIVDEKDARQILKEMLQERGDEPAEKVLVIFCQRYSLTMASCRELYNELVKKGEI